MLATFTIKTVCRSVLPHAYKRYARQLSTSTSNSTANNDPIATVDDMHPLAGIRILDLTRIIAGPYCTMVLADLGAEVIKVERPYVGGDESRKWGPPFLEKSKDATYFLAANRNKKSVCIDLKSGRDIIYELAMKCDVLVENYVPGKLEEYGLGYKSVHKIAPRLIYCSITGYGPTGPYSKRPGYDVIASSIGGLMHITGERNGPPSKVGVAVTDVATGLYAHGAILAALLQRQRTGRGQKIDVNLLSTQVALLINAASNYLNSGVKAERWGTAHANIVPYQTFKTLDGYLTLGTGSDEQFQELCRVLNIENVAQNEKFRTNKDRVAHRAEIIPLLEGILSKDTTSNWMLRFKNTSFPVGPVNSIPDVFSDKHINEIGLVKTLPHAKDGHVRVVGPPVIFSDAKNDARTAPPMVGEHTNTVLKEFLNYSDRKIELLRQQKIIE